MVDIGTTHQGQRVFVALMLLLVTSEAVTITKLPLPGSGFEPIIGKGIATFLTPEEAARVRRQQTSDVVRTSYNADKAPSDTTPVAHRSEPGFYGSNQADGGRFYQDDRRGGGHRSNYYENEIQDTRRYQDGDREYYPKYDRGQGDDGDSRKYSGCRGPRCGPDNEPPRVLFIQPDPGYHTSLSRRGPSTYSGYPGDDRRDYQERWGSGGYQGESRRRPPWDYQEGEYQGMNLRRGPRPDSYSGTGGRWDTPYRNTDPPGELNRVDRLQGGSFYGERDGSHRRPINRDSRRQGDSTDLEYSRYNRGSDRYQGESSYGRPAGEVRSGRWARECRDTPGLPGCESGHEPATVGFYGTAKRS